MKTILDSVIESAPIHNRTVNDPSLLAEVREVALNYALTLLNDFKTNPVKVINEVRAANEQNHELVRKNTLAATSSPWDEDCNPY